MSGSSNFYFIELMMEAMWFGDSYFLILNFRVCICICICNELWKNKMAKEVPWELMGKMKTIEIIGFL